METPLALWSQVVVAELPHPRMLREETSLPIDWDYSNLEDLKIKVRDTAIIPQGMAVETRIVVDILCLLSDEEGKVHLIKQEEMLKDRVALGEFKPPVSHDSVNAATFILDLMQLNWEGNLNKNNLKVACFANYTVLVTREQMVRLSPKDQGEVQGEALPAAMRELENQVARIQEENQELQHQVFYNVRNINSLKKGIHKAESRAASLSQEVQNYQQLIEQLRQSIQEKDEYIQGLSHRPEPNLPAFEDRHDSDEHLGRRIKRLFLNNQ